MIGMPQLHRQTREPPKLTSLFRPRTWSAISAVPQIPCACGSFFLVSLPRQVGSQASNFLSLLLY